MVMELSLKRWNKIQVPENNIIFGGGQVQISPNPTFRDQSDFSWGQFPCGPAPGTDHFEKTGILTRATGSTRKFFEFVTPPSSHTHPSAPQRPTVWLYWFNCWRERSLIVPKRDYRQSVLFSSSCVCCLLSFILSDKLTLRIWWFHWELQGNIHSVSIQTDCKWVNQLLSGCLLSYLSLWKCELQSILKVGHSKCLAADRLQPHTMCNVTLILLL